MAGDPGAAMRATSPLLPSYADRGQLNYTELHMKCWADYSQTDLQVTGPYRNVGERAKDRLVKRHEWTARPGG